MKKPQLQLSIFVAFVAIGFIVVSANLLFSKTFTVTNTSDSGAGSLRQAIYDANNTPAADTIKFAIPTSDPNYNASTNTWTIRPVTELHSIATDSCTIDGATQAAMLASSGATDGPKIELDGSSAGATANGLSIYSSYNTIKGLIINRFSQFGIDIEYYHANYNTICSNYIGTDATGSLDFGNGFSGILIYNGAKHNIIGGNTLADRNIISGNGWSGVEIQSDDADSNIVIGNYIGTDASGMVDLGNDMHGINIWSGAEANTIGGSLQEQRNIISGNAWCGISIGIYSDSNKVVGNYIGMGRDGASAIQNEMSGLCVGSSHNIIGGGNAGEGNLISANSQSGIVLGAGAFNIIAGNYIGTDVTGNLAFPNNEHGIFIYDGATNNMIGPANLIKYNTLAGVQVENSTTLYNTITQNKISENGGLGINNVDRGNLELAPPIITSASPTTISGSALPNSIVEIFSDPLDEGAIFETTVFADAAGNFSFAGALTGPNMTATAILPNFLFRCQSLKIFRYQELCIIIQIQRQLKMPA